MFDKHCSDCIFYRQIDDTVKGYCTNVRYGSEIKARSTRACKRFKEGKNEKDTNMKIIMNTIAENYKGGRWG